MKSRGRRIVIGVVVGLALLLGGLAIVGATHPREHEASRSIELTRSPSEVFAILEDVSAAPCWRSDLQAVDVLGPDRFVEHTEQGEVTYEVVEQVPGQRRVVRIADDDLPYGGTWTYELVPRPDGGTTLTITERGFVDNVLMRGMAAMFMDPEASMVRVQQDLANHRTCP